MIKSLNKNLGKKDRWTSTFFPKLDFFFFNFFLLNLNMTVLRQMSKYNKYKANKSTKYRDPSINIADL